MGKSNEQRINDLRNLITDIVIDVANHQSLIGRDGASELDATANKLEDLAVEFERLVNEIPVEARS